MSSKRLSEEELLRHNESEGGRAFEVVTLACGLVGGDTIQPILWSSIPVVVAPLTGNEMHHNSLKFMQALCGSVPLVHIEDVCEAHLFCMDQPSMAGRFLCAVGYPNMEDYVARFAAKYPEHKILLKKYAIDRLSYVLEYYCLLLGWSICACVFCGVVGWQERA